MMQAIAIAQDVLWWVYRKISNDFIVIWHDTPQMCHHIKPQAAELSAALLW